MTIRFRLLSRPATLSTMARRQFPAINPRSAAAAIQYLCAVSCSNIASQPLCGPWGGVNSAYRGSLLHGQVSAALMRGPRAGAIAGVHGPMIGPEARAPEAAEPLPSEILLFLNENPRDLVATLTFA